MAGTYRYQHGDKPIEGYTVLRGIGRGGFGEVYYAVSDGGREVALKVIQQHHDIELRGVRHCINLKSPHLISIFDVRKNTDGVPFVIMELIAGPSLREVMSRNEKGVGIARAAYFLREIARGLNYLHERGIVHRDLKPENIFYEDGFAKIGDYGLSKYISVSRQSGQTISVGTVHYMAPEIGSGNYHQGIDVYALGIIFYELLTGNVPFNGDSMGEILMKHLTQEPDVSMLDPGLRPVLQRALKKSPAERYQSAREMVDAVFAIPQVAQMVAQLDTANLLSSAGTTASVQGVATADAALRQAETSPLLQPLPGTPPAARVDPPRLEPPPLPGSPRVPPPPPPGRPAATARPSLLEEGLVPGLASVAACAIALAFVQGRPNPEVTLASGLLVAFVSTAVLFAEHWVLPRNRIGDGLLRRCVTFAIVAPSFLGSITLLRALSLSPTFVTNLVPILAGIFAIDWQARTRLNRESQVSAGLAVSAGLFGLISAVVVTGSSPGSPRALVAGALLAALSVVVSATSPFRPETERRVRQRSRPTPAGAPPEGPVGPAPASPLRPAGEPVSSPPPLPENLPGATEGAALAGSGEIAGAPGVRRRLIRPLDGVVAGGVCAAIARAYDWDPSIVRVVSFILLLSSFGTALIAYFLLWIFLPEEAAPGAAPARAGAAKRRRHPGRLRRWFWLLLGAGFFFGGITLAMEDGLGREENLYVWLGLNAVGAFALWRGLRSDAAARPTGPQRLPLGLISLGSVCLILAFVVAVSDSALACGVLDLVFREIGFQPGKVIISVTLTGMLTWTALALFGISLLCFSTARLRKSFDHAVRGLLGWMGLGISFSALLAFAEETAFKVIRVPGPAVISLPTVGAIGYGALAIASLVALGWPHRSTPASEQQPSTPTSPSLGGQLA